MDDVTESAAILQYARCWIAPLRCLAIKSWPWNGWGVRAGIWTATCPRTLSAILHGFRLSRPIWNESHMGSISDPIPSPWSGSSRLDRSCRGLLL